MGIDCHKFNFDRRSIRICGSHNRFACGIRKEIERKRKMGREREKEMGENFFSYAIELGSFLNLEYVENFFFKIPIKDVDSH